MHGLLSKLLMEPLNAKELGSCTKCPPSHVSCIVTLGTMWKESLKSNSWPSHNWAWISPICKLINKFNKAWPINWPKIKAILMLQSWMLSYFDVFFSPWEQHIKPMMNLILLRKAHLDPSKHVSCYWAFDWALIFRSMWAMDWALSMIWV